MIAAVTAIKPYAISARRAVPAGIVRPTYVDRPAPERYTGSHVQTPETIEKMRVSGRIAHNAMLEAAKAIAPGVTTDELDAVAHLAGFVFGLVFAFLQRGRCRRGA